MCSCSWTSPSSSLDILSGCVLILFSAIEILQQACRRVMICLALWPHSNLFITIAEWFLHNNSFFIHLIAVGDVQTLRASAHIRPQLLYFPLVLDIYSSIHNWLTKKKNLHTHTRVCGLRHMYMCVNLIYTYIKLFVLAEEQCYDGESHLFYTDSFTRLMELVCLKHLHPQNKYVTRIK